MLPIIFKIHQRYTGMEHDGSKYLLSFICSQSQAQQTYSCKARQQSVKHNFRLLKQNKTTTMMVSVVFYNSIIGDPLT